ncbi:uncharacterized protein LOC135077727 [Ostrinia nubilalis]|uniref:uncharacterized protein LOC135077727 n=1 Tax=Ostrinia nubilalis TaxID=29057 RepID=UPI00308250AE
MRVHEVLPPKLQKPIENIIQKENFTTYSIDVREIEADGSYLGVLREINIKGETPDGTSKELNLFTKTMIQDGDVNIYSMPYAYANETYMYTEFRDIAYEVQDEYVPQEERFKIAKSYHSTDDQIIIMENLALQGFAMYPRMEVLPLKFAEMAIQQLAKYHSFAFILKEKRPKFFQERVMKMKQPFFYGQKDFNDFTKNFSRISINCFQPELKEKLEKFLASSYDKYAKYTQDPADTWTLVHGDYRYSNVMAKFDNGEAYEVILLDYQHAFYGCSIIDFIYFIIAGTDQDFRRNHLEHLKDVYHNTMAKFLSYFGIDIEKHYPRKEFERLFKERLDYGLMVALWLLPVILANIGEIPDVTKIDLSTCDFQLSDLIKKRVRGVVDDYVQWGYIK